MIMLSLYTTLNTEVIMGFLFISPLCPPHSCYVLLITDLYSNVLVHTLTSSLCLFAVPFLLLQSVPPLRTDTQRNPTGPQACSVSCSRTNSSTTRSALWWSCPLPCLCHQNLNIWPSASASPPQATVTRLSSENYENHRSLVDSTGMKYTYWFVFNVVISFCCIVFIFIFIFILIFIIKWVLSTTLFYIHLFICFYIHSVFSMWSTHLVYVIFFL